MKHGCKTVENIDYAVRFCDEHNLKICSLSYDGSGGYLLVYQTPSPCEVDELREEIEEERYITNRQREIILEQDKRISELEEGLKELIVQYELSAENKFKELGIPLNEEYLPTLSKAKQLLK